MLAALGDLVEDVVVRLHGAINVASDTTAQILRRRGGSAATVTATAAELGTPSRFLGQVGDDAVGAALVDELTMAGVDTAHVRRSGVTGTIVVLVDDVGERSMLTDRKTCIELRDPEPTWLDGVTVLHVPLYSLVVAPLAETARTVIGWADDRHIPLSLDPSSVSVIESIGPSSARRLIEELEPAVVFPNEAEAAALGVDGSLGSSITVVKRGPRPALVYRSGEDPVSCPPAPIGAVTDTTGAGDAFAAGFLSHADTTAVDGPAWIRDPLGACAAGHRAAAMRLG